MLQQLTVPIALVVLGIFLVFIEAFLPSAGVLGLLAALALIAGVVSAYIQGGLYIGTAFLAVTFVMVGVLITWMIRMWPQTTLGRLILVEPAPEDELLPDRSEFQELVGRCGRAESVMLPGGLVSIDGKNFEAISDSTVEANTWVEVVSIKSGRILVVRPVSEEVAMQAQNDEQRRDDPLATPIEEVIPDPFEET